MFKDDNNGILNLLATHWQNYLLFILFNKTNSFCSIRWVLTIHNTELIYHGIVSILICSQCYIWTGWHRQSHSKSFNFNLKIIFEHWSRAVVVCYNVIRFHQRSRDVHISIFYQTFLRSHNFFVVVGLVPHVFWREKRNNPPTEWQKQSMDTYCYFIDKIRAVTLFT